MDNNLDLKVAKTSRSAINSLQNSRSEFQSVIEKIDSEITELSQEVRTPNGSATNESINRINKLKLHRKRLNDMLAVMDEHGETAWEMLRPEAKRTFEEALLARQ
jgi:prefoldin subunit 5